MTGGGKRGRKGQAGFTIVELLIALAIMSVGIGIVALQFRTMWDLWKKNWTELLLQRGARMTLEQMAQGLRQAKPGTVTIDSLAGEPNYSRVAFTHVKEQAWQFYKQGDRVYVVRPRLGTTIFQTDSLTERVEALQFTYPSFQDTALLDIGITLSQTAYRDHIVRLQLTQRVEMRNP